MDQISLEHWEMLREGARVIEHDRHGEKVLLRPDGTYLKLFRRKRLLSSAMWSPYASRFVTNASGLTELGIPCPCVIKVGRVASIARDLVHYHPLVGDTLRDLVRKEMDDASVTYLREAFNRFVRRLHEQGVYFRSLHLGNVVLTPGGELGLIDISDLRLYGRPLSRSLRVRNLRRIENHPNERYWLDRDLILSPNSRSTAVR